jgi:hypothetical protein
MKNLITLVLMIVSLNLFSQVEKPITKGNFLIGGSATGGYYSYKYSGSTSSTKYISASFYPSVGYFIVDGLAFGFSLSSSVYKGLEDYKYSNFSAGIGPMAKYYTPFGIFAGGSISYSFSNTTNNNSSKSANNNISINPELGYAYFINSKIALETSINYSYQFSNSSYENQTQDSSYKYNRLFFSIGFQIFL